MKLKKSCIFLLIIFLALTVPVSAQDRTQDQEEYVNVLKNSYFPNIQHKALTIGQVLGGLEKSINQNENLGGTYSFNVSDAQNVGRGQGKYTQMVLKINNTAISIHFWIDKSTGYVEYLGGEMDDNGKSVTDPSQVLRFINMAYNTAMEVQ